MRRRVAGRVRRCIRDGVRLVLNDGESCLRVIHRHRFATVVLLVVVRRARLVRARENDSWPSSGDTRLPHLPNRHWRVVLIPVAARDGDRVAADARAGPPERHGGDAAGRVEEARQLARDGGIVHGRTAGCAAQILSEAD